MRSLHGKSAPSPRAKAARRRLVIVEHGAGALDLVLSAGEWEETVVVAQGAGDDPIELPFRVMGRIANVERGGRTFDRAVLFVGPRADGRSLFARRLVARALYAHLGTAERGEIVLAAQAAGVDQRHELLALVEALVGEHERSPVTIRLQLADPSRAAAGLDPNPAPAPASIPTVFS